MSWSAEKNIQNRQLQTWLSEDEYAQIEAEWKEQLELRSELEDKPSDLKRYEEKLREVTFNYNRAEGYSSKGKHNTAKKFYSRSESLCEDVLEILQEILHYDSSYISKQNPKILTLSIIFGGVGITAWPRGRSVR